MIPENDSNTISKLLQCEEKKMIPTTELLIDKIASSDLPSFQQNIILGFGKIKDSPNLKVKEQDT